MRYGFGLAAVAACVTIASANDTIDQLMDRFQVDELWVTTIRETEPVDGERVLSFDLGGEPVFVPIHDHSVRSRDFVWRHQVEGGVFVDVEPPAETTFRGTVEGMPASIVAGGYIDGEPMMMVFLEHPDGETWGVEPAGDGSGRHVVFRTAAINTEGYCMVAEAEGVNGAVSRDFDRPELDVPSVLGAPRVVEVGMEGDFSFVQRNSSSPVIAQNRIDAYTAIGNVIYERDVNLTFEISGTVLRLNAGQDPYTTSDASSRLGQVRSQWNGPLSDIPTDISYTFTGVNLTSGGSSGVLGIAFLSGVCNSNGVGLVEGRFNDSTVALIYVHEAGHNWSAQHCDGAGQCRIMCAGFGGCNGFGNPARFAPVTISQINGYAATRGCIDNVTVPFPITDTFPTTQFDGDLWPEISGATIQSVSGAPSAPNAARIDGGESLEGAPFSYALNTGLIAGVQLDYRAVTSASTGDLVVEYNRQGNWNFLADVPASESSDDFRTLTIPIPPAARFGNIPVRFRGAGAGSVHIDDVTFGEFPDGTLDAQLPFAEGFESGVLPLDRWFRQDDVSVEADAAAPEGGRVLALGNGEITETNALAGLALEDIIVGAFLKSDADFDSLGIEYLTSGGSWNLAGFVLGFDATDWTLFEVTVPFTEFHSGLQIRFVPSTGGGDWQVDDVLISTESRESVGCPADFDGDGNVNVLDVVAFINNWNAQGPGADFDGDGNVNVLDVVAFVNTWNAGCP